MMLHSTDGTRTPSCICSQQRTQSHCSTLDDVSEGVEDDDDADSSCSPNCDCQHSSSSTCHSPVTESEPSLGRKHKSKNGEAGRNRQPFYLHPRKDADLSSMSRSAGSKSSFFLNSSDKLENRKNQTLSSGHHHHHHHRHHRRHHHENQHAEQQPKPFYLHDPNSIVYTRVKELFGCEYESKRQRQSSGKKHVDKNRSANSTEAGFCSSHDSTSTRSHSVNSEMTASQAESVSDCGSESSVSLSNDDDHNNNLIQSTQPDEFQVLCSRTIALKVDWFSLTVSILIGAQQSGFVRFIVHVFVSIVTDIIGFFFRFVQIAPWARK